MMLLPILIDLSLLTKAVMSHMERNSVYCLLCNKPQQSIATHLKRVCMKNNTPEEREQEASRAITSQKIFAREGRVWDFSELEEYCKDAASCVNLCHRLQSRGFIVTNTPQICLTIQPTQRSQKKDVLAVAKKEIDYIQQRIVSGDYIPNTAATTFRHYCEAILLLEHRLTGNAVMELCVQDWIDRKPVADGVCIQLSSTAQCKSFTLTKEEEGLFECYFNNIRPVSLEQQSVNKDDKSKFFLGEGGVPLSNPASDLQRLKAKYLPLESEDAVAASASQSEALKGQPTPGQASASLPTAPASMQDWDAFCKTFPVTLNGDPPSKKQSIQAGFPHYRPYYHKWRDLQLGQRTQYILRNSTHLKQPEYR
ncbi:uncharacterized protein [Trachinotus anak]|uniref:uncharacterized protein n=1 Tax=Trachinotus anak TaxID=443729 RepID=UPI0039F1917E